MGKIKDRFGFGWTDPRSMQTTQGAYYPKLDIDTPRPTEFSAASTATLRDLWMVKWGKRAISHEEIAEADGTEEPILEVMQELANRHQVRFDQRKSFDVTTVTNYYVLEREDGDR